ncbi:sigma-54-dependent transcriptional regulator [Saccharicrinis aurantiacus]|uniref:sigma-54-dependent transcriptional regulator n=1 Tax=Saccharicrinis aurantiacus TaxID=1849719 RepID=UPI00249069A6|nr:sigma-54 dependent transcriptional regulator [Saccharicrinis aurantiacus]
MKINVVEDDKVYNKLIERSIAEVEDVEIIPFFNGESFLNQLTEDTDIVTLDLGLPDYSGLEILKRIKKFNANIDVIIISGEDSVSGAVQLLKEGAYDYIIKDDNIKDRLHNSIHNIINKKSLINEISLLKNEISKKYSFGTAILGDSPSMKNVLALIEKAIKVPNINISIYGESGTGKELAAKTIHYNSSRKNAPFVTLNMSAIPKEYVEEELFGSSNENKLGKFADAEKGTIFIDEIGEMDLNLQAKLLRVIQEGEIKKSGSRKGTKVNCRIIVATNKNLLDEISAGNFREDLYYRLLGLPIYIPSLKERKHDIILLGQHFLDVFCSNNSLEKKTFTTGAKQKLMSYAYPGNVRELKAIVELSAVMAADGKVDEEDVMLTSSNAKLDLLAEKMTLKEYTERIIRHFLKENNNNVLKVAQILDIGKSTIYNMKKRDQKDKDFNMD